MTAVGSTSAQLRRALAERDEAVRIALDTRAELTRVQQAYAASQADLSRVEGHRDELNTQKYVLLAELERLRNPTHLTEGAHR